MKAHPYADAFPMLPESELLELAESIEANGLRSPIVVTTDGLILDGRNRAAACERIGITPATVVYEGEDLAEYVIDVNTSRRHMSTGARAMSTALVLQADGRREHGRWKRDSLGDSQRSLDSDSFKEYLRRAGIVLDWLPDHAARVIAGDLALDAAYKQADDLRRSKDAEKIRARELAKREKEQEKAEAERDARIIADLEVLDDQRYADFIVCRQLSPVAAWAAYQEDTRKEREAEKYHRQGCEQAAAATARAVLTLEALTVPEAFARFLDEEWPVGYLGATPAARDRMTPDTFRAIADSLNKLAANWKGTPHA